MPKPSDVSKKHPTPPQKKERKKEKKQKLKKRKRRNKVEKKGVSGLHSGSHLLEHNRVCI